MTEPKPAAIYIRVSSAPQADRYGSNVQDAACRTYAEHNNLKIVADFSDTTSGSTIDRPGIMAALEAASAGTISVLILYDHTRLGRTVGVSRTLRDQFQSAGCRLAYAIGGSYEPDTEEALIMDTVSDMMSEAEVKRMTRRMTGGRRRSARAGNVPIGGAVRYGYARVRDHALKQTRLEAVPAEAAEVRRIFGRWNEGQSADSIAADLNRRKIPKHSPSPWRRKDILRMLRSEVYVGRWYYGKVRQVNGKRTPVAREDWIPVDVPPIVDKSTFAKAQVRRRANVRAHSKHITHKYLLRSRIKCSDCGRTYWAITQKYSYYIHPPMTDCPNRNHVRRSRLEAEVQQFVVDFLVDPDRKWELFEEEQQQAEQYLEKQLETVDRRRERLEDQRARARRLVVEGTLTREDYTAEVERIASEDETFQAEAGRLRSELESEWAYLEPPWQDQADFEMDQADLRATGAEYFDWDGWNQILEQYHVRLEVNSSGRYLLEAEIGDVVLPIGSTPSRR